LLTRVAAQESEEVIPATFSSSASLSFFIPCFATVGSPPFVELRGLIGGLESVRESRNYEAIEVRNQNLARSLPVDLFGSRGPKPSQGKAGLKEQDA